MLTMFNRIAEKILFVVFKFILAGIGFSVWASIVGLASKKGGVIVGAITALVLLLIMNCKPRKR